MQSLPSRGSYQFPSERSSLFHLLFSLLLKATLFLIAGKATACQVADKESQLLPILSGVTQRKRIPTFKAMEAAKYLSFITMAPKCMGT